MMFVNSVGRQQTIRRHFYTRSTPESQKGVEQLNCFVIKRVVDHIHRCDVYIEHVNEISTTEKLLNNGMGTGGFYIGNSS